MQSYRTIANLAAIQLLNGSDAPGVVVTIPVGVMIQVEGESPLRRLMVNVSWEGVLHSIFRSDLSLKAALIETTESGVRKRLEVLGY